MTKDEELLELAAKAAGYELMQFELGDGCFEDAYRTKDGYWNPLTDDGDALRLAVKLRLSCVDMPVGYMTEEELADLNNDPYTFARRAIVRAAAEIGKTL